MAHLNENDVIVMRLYTKVVTHEYLICYIIITFLTSTLGTQLATLTASRLNIFK